MIVPHGERGLASRIRNAGGEFVSPKQRVRGLLADSRATAARFNDLVVSSMMVSLMYLEIVNETNC